ncbi:MAG: cation:proton antiporter [Limisphaerales bacterium]
MSLTIALVLIIVLGLTAQWLAWRLRLPSILLLLLFGFGAGQFLNPDELVGSETVSAFVALAVATILLEGGLSLRISEIRETRKAVLRLCSVGVILAWGLTAAAARWITGLDWTLAALLGALLVVTGPTVITPLLRQIKPVRSVGAIARWEGIVVDPIGAVLAVLVFQTVLAASRSHAFLQVAQAIGLSILVGGIAAIAVARVVEEVFKRHWVPDFLHSPVLLAIGLACYVAANTIQPEVGLLSVTVLGIALANQKSISLNHVLEFKETLRVLLISSLFILLAARLDFASLKLAGPQGLLFVAVLILVVRPVSVLFSTLGSGLEMRQRIFLSLLAPRGIVAAAVTAIFAREVIEAIQHGRLPHRLEQQAQLLEPLAFVVIIGTVTTYGLLAGPIARRLRLAAANPQGILFVGASSWVIQAARELKAAGIDTLLIDSSPENVAKAQMEKLRAVHANILSRYVSEELELFGIGRLVATTPNLEVNSLACQEFIHQFGRENVFQLAHHTSASEMQDVSHRLQGRALFAPHATQRTMEQWIAKGAKVKRSNLTEQYTYQEFLKRYGSNALVLFVLNGNGACRIQTKPPENPEPGTTLISLILDAAPSQAQAPLKEST